MRQRLIFNLLVTKRLTLAFFLFFSIIWGLPVGATTIFSPIVQLKADPGESVRGVVKIYNESEADTALAASLESFEAAGESGKPAFVPPSEKNSFLAWFTLDQDSVVLKKKQAIIVPFTIVVPPNATPGGYYAVIFWQTVNNSGTKNSAVGVNSKVGTLVFLTVNGEVVEKGELKSFDVGGGKWHWQLPINFDIRFSNQGNIHLQPTGKIELSGWFGQHKTYVVNDDQGYVLPGSVRNFQLKFGGYQATNEIWLKQLWLEIVSEVDHFAFGPFTAQLTFNYGSQPQSLTAENYFWYVPVKLIGLGVIMITAILLMVMINRRVKRLKQKIKNDQKLPKSV
ncbi:MAG: hypothetical protein PHW95_05010 [Patescibacteria group bacterium]|nr:hypothetical protein [Patescibacteria group bacterium]